MKKSNNTLQEKNNLLNKVIYCIQILISWHTILIQQPPCWATDILALVCYIETILMINNFDIKTIWLKYIGSLEGSFHRNGYNAD